MRFQIMQIKFCRPEIFFSTAQELSCSRSVSLPFVLSLLTPAELRLDVRSFTSDMRLPPSPPTTIMNLSMSMNGPANLCFGLHSSLGIRTSSFFSSHFSSLSPHQLERIGQGLLPTHRAPFLLRLFGCSRSDSFARGRQISLAKCHPKRNLIYHGRLQFRKTSA